MGSAQTRQGFALDPPPFEKGGPKLCCGSTERQRRGGLTPAPLRLSETASGMLPNRTQTKRGDTEVSM